MTLQRPVAAGGPTPGLPGRRVRARALAPAALAVLALQTASAMAIDFGPLVLRRDAPQKFIGHLRLSDSTPIEPGQLSVRLAHADAYRALGLRYEPALAAASVTTQPTMDSGLTVLIQPLPASTPDQRPLDVVLIVFEGIKLYTRHYRVDLHGQRTEFAGIDPGETGVAAAPRGAPTAPAASTTTTASPGIAAVPVAAEPGAADSAAHAEVLRALAQWSRAWAGRNVDAYMSAYEVDFRGSLGSRAAWQAQRRERILARRQIEVELTDIKLELQGARAEARFTQRYRGDELRQTHRKRLLMVRHGGEWLIREEVAL